MPATARWRWLPALLGLALLLLMLGVVALGRFYWLHLHASVDRLQVSIAEARAQQWRMVQRVREAEAALAASAEQMGLDTAADRRSPRPDGVWVERAGMIAVAAEMERLALILADASAAHHDRIDWPRRAAELRLLGRDALRLPPARQAGGTIGGRQVRALLEQAAHGADLGDAQLVVLILDAAARLLREHYAVGRPTAPQATALADRIEHVRTDIAPDTQAHAAAQLIKLASALRTAAAEQSRDRGDTPTARRQ